MDKPVIGILNIGMEVYNHDIVDPIVKEAIGKLEKSCEVIYGGKTFKVEDAISKLKKILVHFPDLMVVFFSTWCNASIALSVIKECTSVPIMLWSIPMINGYTTGSFVAFSVVKGTLEALGIDFDFAYGLPSKVVNNIKKGAQLSKLIKDLGRERLGLIGYPAMNMYTATYDDLSIKGTFGMDIIHIDNSRLLRVMEKAPRDEISKILQDLLKKYKLADKNLKSNLERIAAMYLALKRIIREDGLTALTVECQFEQSRTIGCPCLPLSLLAEEKIHTGCEGDIHGLITLILVNKLSGKPSFFSDVLNAEGDNVIFSACGCIPPSLTSGEIVIKQQADEIGKEGLIFSAVPKRGKVAIARLGIGRKKDYTMYITTGEIVEGYRRKHIYENGKEDYLFPICKVKLGYHSDIFVKNIISNHYIISWSDIKDDLLRVCGKLKIKSIVYE